MPIQGNCPGCGKAYRVPDEAGGRTVACPACKTKFAIAVPASEAPDQGYQLTAEEPAQPAAAPRAKKTPPPKPACESASAELAAAPGEHDPFALAGSSAPSTTVPAQGKKVRKPAGVSSKAAEKRSARLPNENAPASRSYLWFAIALLPLCLALFLGSDDVVERFVQAAEEDPEAVATAMADQRLPGSHLARDTWLHWPYACVSALGMFLFLRVTLPRGNSHPGGLIGAALAVAFGGICLLIAIQWLADFSLHVRTGRGILGMIFAIPKLIAFSYRAAFDPESGFLMSLVGFTLGVGLCEELIKALPLLAHFRGEGEFDWQEACAWGAACGLGFGVAEGVIYSSDFYNGVAAWDAYVVRFVSCVALHAILTATVGILAWQHQGLLQGDLDWVEFLQAMLYVLGGPMVLHGLFDTFLKKDMPWGAMVTALASFALLGVLIELHSNRAEGLRGLLQRE